MGRKLKLPLDYFYKKIRPFIFWKDPEIIHSIMLSMVEKFLRFPVFLKLLNSQFNEEFPTLHIRLFGNNLANPVGLAAGFDKDGRIYRALFAIGFSFVEIGTVTPLPQFGNSLPRLFRLFEDKALINNLGFNNNGAIKMLEKLSSRKNKINTTESKAIQTNIESGLLGINIGKNMLTPIENANKDYVSALKTLYPFADYFTLNVSSPNTNNLRNLQKNHALRNLLDEICTQRDRLDQKYSRKTPLLLKLSPDMTNEDLKKSIIIIKEFSIQGIIATNTTVKRERLRSKYQSEKGGLSGKPLQNLSTLVIKELFRELGDNLKIIGVGGIFNGQDAYEKIRAGASAVQIYTGLIYEGPGLVLKVKKELSELLENDGFKTVEEAIGVDN